jgi:uncharacterized repeat protein (TIGR03803 family)
MRPSRFLIAAFLLSAVLLSFASISAAQAVRTLYNFDGTIGSLPAGFALTQGRDGQLYGTTIDGGDSNLGAVFKITPTGHITALHSFNGTDGAFPFAGLALGADGSFYGATDSGGTGNVGTFFKITSTGNLTVLHNFQNDGTDGAYPVSAPILAADGNFYGATFDGGLYGDGALYKFTPSGTETIIFNYDYTDGWLPYSPTQGNDGSLYVASQRGGSGGGNGCGTLTNISTTGILINTYLFDCASNGWAPVDVVQASDGNFYGTASFGGVYSEGVLFRLSPSFNYTVLHSFGATVGEGTEPVGLIQATDGKLYGTDFAGGNFNDGTIYTCSLSGTCKTLFTWDSQVEASGLVQHTTGALYGTTYNGGTNSLGSIYALNVGLEPFVALPQPQGKAGSTAQILGEGLRGATSVTFNGIPATSFKAVTDTFMTAVVPSGATTGKVVVTTPGGALTSNVNFRILQ